VTTGWLRSPNGEVAVDKPRIGSKKRWCEMNLPNYSIGRHRQLGSTANLTGIRFPDIAKMSGKRCGPVLVCGNAWNRCSVAVQMRSAHKSHRRGRYQPADFNGVSFQTWHAEGKSNFLLAGDKIVFPDCPKHPGLTTVWKTTVDDNIVRLGKPRTPEFVMPPFHAGDQVVFVGPGLHRGKHGNVVAVIDGSLDHVCRYQVRLSDGTQVRCFGFELQSLDEISSKSA
jgi:hypothetical protein